MAEMIAARIFNERKNNRITEIYGVVTTGTNWKFLRYCEQTIEVDLNDYFIDNISKIIGILKYLVDSKSQSEVGTTNHKGLGLNRGNHGGIAPTLFRRE